MPAANAKSAVKTHALWSAPVVLLCAMAALASGVWALATTTDGWARWFAHPLVEASLTRDGAALWRGMLGVLAIALAGGSIALVALQRHGSDAEALRRQPIARTTVYIVGGLTLIALLLRSLRINESLWYDEIASWRTYNGGANSSGAIIGAFLDPINHTLHTLLNRWSVEWLAGRTTLEFAFRLPALAFSLASVPVMFGLGRAAASERIGLLAAALAAVAPVCVLEGVEARSYAQMIFFSAAATWAFIAAFRQASPGLWLLYALCCAVGVWSHFVTAWIAIGHAAWLAQRLVRARDDRTRCAQGFVAIALAGIGSITFYAPLIPGLLAWRRNFAAQASDQPGIFGIEGWHALLQLGGSWTPAVAAIGLVLFAIGLIAAWREPTTSPRSIRAIDALGLSLGGVLLMAAAVAVAGTWVYARFLLFAMPGALLAMALGLDALWRWRRAFGIAAFAAYGVASVMNIVMLPPKQPLRDAVDFVRGQWREGDRIVAVGLAHDVLRIYGMELPIVDSFMFGRDLEAKLDELQPRWVIVEYPLRVPHDRFEALAARGYRETVRFEGWADWGHGDVAVFAR